MSSYPTPDYKKAAVLNKISVVFTIVVLILVGLMRQYKFDVGIDFSFLPAVSSMLNSIVAVCLVMALIFIKRKQVEKHKKAIYAAMIFSALFFVCYILYHFTTVETRFCKEGAIRTIYYVLLFSHIILAGISLPFILFTFVRGFTYQVDRHRKMARWVFPIWLYVAISGPLVYILLKPCYL
ncbi:MAG: DUF420 domain-containing protein [Saprospiraceae bacterium]|nr:DUF420 domain-containing protein [Saprospiraceae bacterium]